MGDGFAEQVQLVGKCVGDKAPIVLTNDGHVIGDILALARVEQGKEKGALPGTSGADEIDTLAVVTQARAVQEKGISRAERFTQKKREKLEENARSMSEGGRRANNDCGARGSIQRPGELVLSGSIERPGDLALNGKVKPVRMIPGRQ